MKHNFTLVFAILLSIQVFSQVSHGGKPLPYHPTAISRSSSDDDINSAIHYIDMPTMDWEKYKKEVEEENSHRSLRFAHKFLVTINSENSGETFSTPDFNVWRVAVRSKDALSLNVFFSKYRLPKGAKLFIYSPDQKEILGSYTEQNNSKSNILPVQPIGGDRFIVEYQEPHNAEFRGEVEIGEVNHDFIGILRSSSSGPGRPYEDCHSDLICFNEDIETAKGVMLIVLNGTELCTGSLVNNTNEDNTPYLLTATHCLDKAQPKDKVEHYIKGAESIICFFNYNSPVCEKEDNRIAQHFQGPSQMSVASSELVLVNQLHDITLLKLKELPPKEYQPQLLGWNADEDPEDGNYRCIHHPAGGAKKVSIFTGELMRAWRPPYKENGHWYVENWDEGISEGGSSGSPLLDKEKRIIGTLTSGSSHCRYHAKYTGKAGPDLYASIPVVWNERTALNTKKSLKEFLDPINSGKLSFGAKNPYADSDIVFKRISNYTPLEAYEPQYSSGSSFFETGGELSSNEFAEEFSIAGKSKVYGVFIANPPIKAHYTIKNMDVKVRIYSGKNGPEKLLAETDLDYSHRGYSWLSDKEEKGFMDLSFATENFIKFDTPVAVNEKFYVSYAEIALKEGDPGFAVLNIQNRADKGGRVSTIWAKRTSAWTKIDKIQNATFSSSLMISPYLISDEKSKKKKEEQVWAYHESNGDVTIQSLLPVKRTYIFTTDGEACYTQESSQDETSSAKHPGKKIYAEKIPSTAFQKKGLYLVGILSDTGAIVGVKVLIR